MRVLLVGEAPNATRPELRRPAEALTGAIGRRLAELAGIRAWDYLRGTERRNLLAAYPGETWPSGVARGRAYDLLPELAERRTILFGRRVARAFGLEGEPLLAWRRPFDALVPGAEVAVAPHPSGRNRWWNDPANRAAAAAFLAEALGKPLTNDPSAPYDPRGGDDPPAPSARETQAMDPLSKSATAAPPPVRLPHCTPSAFSGHSLLCDRDGRFCSLDSQHRGPCRPHGTPR